MHEGRPVRQNQSVHSCEEEHVPKRVALPGLAQRRYPRGQVRQEVQVGSGGLAGKAWAQVATASPPVVQCLEGGRQPQVRLDGSPDRPLRLPERLG